MKMILAACALTALIILAALGSHAQTAASATAAQGGGGARQDRLIGEVTAIDPAAGGVTVKTDAGESVSAAFDEKTTFLRVAPGAKSIEGAAKITRAEVAAGDRVLVLLRAGVTEPVARQLVVMSREAIAERREQEREEARRRRLVGRIASVDAARREVTVTTRGREGAEQVVISAAEGARVLRFAPDSMRPADAVPSSFAELKAGDQVRARGERSADGARFTAEEILAGQFVRVGGTVTDVNAERGEVAVRNEQTGKTVTVVLAKKSTLRRVPAEFAESFAERRGGRRQASEGEGGERRQMTDAERNARREERRRERAARGQQGQGAGDEQGRRRGGGGNFQQAFENFPAVAAAELKKGDAVLVTGTPGADQSSVTAITLVTGDAEFLRRLQRMQGRQDGDPRGMSPGLPGDVLGGGNVNRDQPREQP